MAHPMIFMWLFLLTLAEIGCIIGLSCLLLRAKLSFNHQYNESVSRRHCHMTDRQLLEHIAESGDQVLANSERMLELLQNPQSDTKEINLIMVMQWDATRTADLHFVVKDKEGNILTDALSNINLTATAAPDSPNPDFGSIVPDPSGDPTKFQFIPGSAGATGMLEVTADVALPDGSSVTRSGSVDLQLVAGAPDAIGIELG